MAQDLKGTALLQLDIRKKALSLCMKGDPLCHEDPVREVYSASLMLTEI